MRRHHRDREGLETDHEFESMVRGFLRIWIVAFGLMTVVSVLLYIFGDAR